VVGGDPHLRTLGGDPRLAVLGRSPFYNGGVGNNEKDHSTHAEDLRSLEPSSSTEVLRACTTDDVARMSK